MSARALSAGAIIEVAANYLRSSGERVVVTQETFAVTSGTQQLPMAIDLTSCLSDAAREGGIQPTCPLHLVIVLRDSSLVAPADTIEFGPIAVGPGTTVSVATPTATVAPGGVGIRDVTAYTFVANSGTIDASTYQWDFGDGSTGAGQAATHVYAHEGSYHVTLRLAGSTGAGSAATDVRVGTLSGTWTRPPASGVGLHLVMTQQGTEVSGRWYVVIDADSPFAAPGNAVTYTPLTGSISADGKISVNEGGGCLRVVNGGAFNASLTSFSGPAAYGNPSCGNGVTSGFTYEFDRASTPDIRGVIISQSSATLGIGNSTTFTATVDADSGANTAVVWSSANPLIASVSGGGIVTGVAPGTTSVSAKSAGDANRFASVPVTVQAAPAVRGITLSVSAASLRPSTSVPITATVAADTGADQTLSWSSSNPSVATVTQTGVVSGVAFGNADITAKSVSTPSVAVTLPVFVCGVATVSTINVAGNSLPANLGLAQGALDVFVGGDVAAPGVTAVRLGFVNGPTTNYSVTAPAGPNTAVPIKLTPDTRQLPNGTYRMSLILQGTSSKLGCGSFGPTVTVANP